MISKKPLYEYFTRNEWLFYVVVVTVGLMLRWYDLGLRPPHHDEAIYYMFARYYFDNPTQMYYKYAPAWHGPLLFNLYRWVLGTFGTGLIAARIPMTLIGSAFIVTPLYFRHLLSKRAIFILTTAYCLSPTLIFWSRFLRHDPLVYCGMFLVLYGALAIRRQYAALLVSTGLAIQFCTKENVYVSVAIMLGYLVFENIFEYCFLQTRTSLLRKIALYLKKYWKQSLIALLWFICIYVYLYTAGFRHLAGEGTTFFEQYFGALYDAVYRKSIGYWMEHHTIERIKGPFLYQFFILCFYELPFVLAYGYCLYLLYQRGTHFTRTAIKVLILCAAIAYLFHLDYAVERFSLWRFFKLKSRLDAVGLIFFIGISPIITIHHLLRNERRLAFWGYLFSATLFTYSYLGEKVPWLSSYPLVAGLIYFSLFFDKYLPSPLPKMQLRTFIAKLSIIGMILSALFFVESYSLHGSYELERSTAILLIASALLGTFYWWGHRLGFRTRVAPLQLCSIVAIGFMLRCSITTNYTLAGQASELISQVHTSREMHAVLERLARSVKTHEPGYPPKILMDSPASWPSIMYLHGLPGLLSSGLETKFSEKELLDYDYVLTEGNNIAMSRKLPPAFRTQKLKLGGWWVPDYRLMTVKNFLSYAITHTPWSITGYSYFTLGTNTKKLWNVETPQKAKNTEMRAQNIEELLSGGS